MNEEPKWQDAKLNFDEMTKPLKLSKEILKQIRKDLVQRKVALSKLQKRNKGKK